jgi:carbonic anhydrase
MAGRRPELRIVVVCNAGNVSYFRGDGRVPGRRQKWGVPRASSVYTAFVSRTNITAAAALERLREGNGRFASNVRSITSLISQERRAEHAAAQSPFAIILGCSDSRAPAEIVFDQGLGDLFVIRVAGNIVAPSQVGSVEFAADRFGTPLVVVMGHTQCGAIAATIDTVAQTLGGAAQSRNILSIVDRIRPAVEPLARTELAKDRNALARAAGRANVRIAVDHLNHGSPILEELIANKGLAIVGAEYDIETGVVDFFEGVEEAVSRSQPPPPVQR